MSTFLLSGASGFIGKALAKSLAAEGHRVVRLTRAEGKSVSSGADAVRWDPEAGAIDREALARTKPDAVINLAGEPIAQRWTSGRRRRIRDSRVNGTTALAQAIAGLADKPSVLVSGSAIGYYGAHRGDEQLDEDSAPGSDFLATTACEWERAAEPAAQVGIRVAIPRTGIVLGKNGGALAKMLLPFKLGLGGRFGTGRQWMSWIALDDAVHALRFLADNPALRGPVNLVAPNPVRNRDFTKALAEVYGRYAPFPVPSIALELMFGSMADSTILASQRVTPKKLAGAGFEYRHPRLDDALRSELKR